MRDKTLNYRRVEWVEGVNPEHHLEWCLSQAHKLLKTVEDRTVVRPSGQCIRSVRKREPHAGGILVHLTADTPGEQASVVPTVKGGIEETDVSTTKAPPDAEFMDGDAFLFVSGNDVCMCSTGLRDGAIRQFLYDFFRKAKLGDDATKFDLFKVANVNKLKMLHQQGVKAIELRTSLFQATALYEKRKNQSVGILRTIARNVNAIVGGEKEDSDDSLRVELVIKTDERFRGGLAISEKKIALLAQDIVKNQEDHDDYVIVTNKGQKISPLEIQVQEVVQIETHGKSVRRERAWDHLHKFYSGLKQAGSLEQ